MVRSSQAGMVLFAQIGQLLRWDLGLAAGALIGVVALGIWALVMVKRWREETIQDDAFTPGQLLEHYREMVDNGSLDPEEFARIKAQLENRADPMPPSTQSDQSPPSQPPDTSIHEK